MTDLPALFEKVRKLLTYGGDYPNNKALAALDEIASRQHACCVGCSGDGGVVSVKSHKGNYFIRQAIAKKCAGLRLACRGEK